MSFDLLRAAGGSDSSLCSMQSIISSLQHQYSAAASAVSQAMLLQAMSQTSGLPTNPQQEAAGQRSAVAGLQPARSREDQHKTQRKNQLGQHVPLDLSVKIQPTRSRSSHTSRQSKQQLPLNLARTSPDLNNNGHQQSSKLITSSTSPLSGSSTLSANNERAASFDGLLSPASSLDGDDDDNDNNSAQTNANTSNQDVISSTNGRQRRHGMRKPKVTRAHLCTFCGRSFSRSDMLSRHSRLHSGLKPYQCGKCYQVFSRSDHLSTHERTHTGEKPYQCNYCAYSACRRDMITRHMRTHTTGRNSGQRPRLYKSRVRRKKKKTSVELEASGDNKLKPLEDVLAERDEEVFID